MTESAALVQKHDDRQRHARKQDVKIEYPGLAHLLMSCKATRDGPVPIWKHLPRRHFQLFRLFLKLFLSSYISAPRAGKTAERRCGVSPIACSAAEICRCSDAADVGPVQ